MMIIGVIGLLSGSEMGLCRHDEGGLVVHEKLER